MDAAFVPSGRNQFGPIRHYVSRIAGPSMALGGLVWIVIWARWASLPEPAAGEVKPGGELFDMLNVLCVALVVIGFTGAHFLPAVRTWSASASSVVLLWAGVAMMATWVVGLVGSYMAFVGGVLTLLLGLAIFCLSSIRAQVLPTSAIVPVIVGVLLFPFMNPDDLRALLAVPMGASWLWLGYVLWRLAARSSRVP